MFEEMARRQVGRAVVLAGQGDLTRQDVGAIVNAAGEYLRHGGGVAAAIVRAGGPVIQEESDRWVETHGPLQSGQATVTSGGDLPARWVVHTVGPRYREGQDNEGLLRSAVSSALEVAARNDARSVALPAISAGIFGYPPEEAVSVIADQVLSWLSEHPGELHEVRLVGYDPPTAAAFATALREP